jgi:hypothetical protein
VPLAVLSLPVVLLKSAPNNRHSKKIFLADQRTVKRVSLNALFALFASLVVASAVSESTDPDQNSHHNLES